MPSWCGLTCVAVVADMIVLSIFVSAVFETVLSPVVVVSVDVAGKRIPNYLSSLSDINSKKLINYYCQSKTLGLITYKHIRFTWIVFTVNYILVYIVKKCEVYI